MKDEDKCYALLSTNSNMFVNVCTEQIESSSSLKLSEIKIDSKLNYKEQIRCKYKN